jgi:hypothetical protein
VVFCGFFTFAGPLSIMDLALPPRHGSDLRVAYQGVPGAYSEAAAAKAYPQCEAVPCEQFDAAFQVDCCRFIHITWLLVSPSIHNSWISVHTLCTPPLKLPKKHV